MRSKVFLLTRVRIPARLSRHGRRDHLRAAAARRRPQIRHDPNPVLETSTPARHQPLLLLLTPLPPRIFKRRHNELQNTDTTREVVKLQSTGK